MIRNLMMILGLSLAVAALGCDSESSNGGGSGGTAGTGGTAGSAGAGGAGGDGGAGGEGGSTGPTDACTNEADLAIVCPEAFQDNVRTCATAAAGQPGPTAACLVEDTGVSADCASCYGDTSGCILANCLGSGCATDANGEDCLACRAEFCDDALNSCTGDLSVCPE